MQAMIFAAGLGTRLRPHTSDKPKALVEVAGKPLLQHQLEKLEAAGCTRAVINVHHFAGLVENFVQGINVGMELVISDEREELLDTGGGLLKARRYFGEFPVLVHNVDVFSDLDLRAFYESHLQSGAAATLAVRARESSRKLLADGAGQLIGWKNVKTGEYKWGREGGLPTAEYGFSGIQAINKTLLDITPFAGRQALIPLYLEWARSHFIRLAPHNEGRWLDVGKPETLAQARRFVQ